MNEKIFVKYGSRSCTKHLDENGFIKKDLIESIRTKLKPINYQLLFMIDYLEPKKYFLFEKFKDINRISDIECKEITGWTKKEFICFTQFITKINNNSQRTKEQLIALYRYWIRTGTNQSTLAKLFGNKTTQVQISNYLSQIRNAIYNEFVPYFLGSNRKREFFLKHNNQMVMELHQLNKDDLVIVCDGTYTRFEKSSNNEFQYLSYSVQKSATLLNPFIICCADGFIIDCYGAFEAGKNDASILKYILENDKDLAKLLKLGKTVVFLDRGFRDIYKILIEQYNFNVQIPTCQQLENHNEENNSKNKQLTVKQTNETRLVTECRFIIEKQIGRIKSCAALDHIRNTEIGYIQIDYRICCAMINFTHKPCCPDEKNVFKITKILRNKLRKNEKHLEFLLGKQLGTKLITPINLFSIGDFPKIRRVKIQNRIFLGSFQLNKSGTAFVVSKKLLKSQTKTKKNNDLEYSKIIAVQIPSRHRRSKKKEKPTEKENSHIKSFKNTYRFLFNMIHQKKVGNQLKAIYVNLAEKWQDTVVIYFLSYAKYHSMDFPAEYLNSVFVRMEECDSPNKPKYIKNKREKKFINEDSSASSDSSDLEEDFEPEKDTNEDNLNESISSENTDDGQHETDDFGFLSLEEFIKHIPKWGGRIEYKGLKDTFVSNTCTIDYFLLAFWLASKLSPNFLTDIIIIKPKKHVF
ncbi:unnamed protein product [Brachionus calyciflorus]|uniref:DDE Tnp4 domain-containing protein n=1 Tax=Brachionus calyciflorus TaxID=104777 RepID=A0A814CYN8_9BILA|nr:unnamed protein product [Brachionus calyciflorus]